MDFEKLAATTNRLIAANGRLINIIRVQRGTDNPLKPWRGDPTPRLQEDGEDEEVEIVASVRASFIEPSSLVRFGFKSEELDGTRRVEQVALISAVSLGENDLTYYDEIMDGTIRYKIELIRRIAPADVALLYMVGVRR